MLVRFHQQRLEWQVVKWIALFALASALALAIATTMAGAAEVSPQRDAPRILPTEMEDWSIPIQTGIERQTSELLDEIWAALELRQDHRLDESIDAWIWLSVPPEAEVWKQVALAESYLELGNLSAAEQSICQAVSLRPENPLVHFLIGQLRLAQSAHADEWYDATRPPWEAMLTAQPGTQSGMPRSVYRFDALMALEESLRLSAEDHWLDEPLARFADVECVDIVPCAHDLLRSMEATGYVARSHQLLGGLHCEFDWLETAEQHLDTAVAAGLTAPTYSILADRFEEKGRHIDAFRVHLKAAQHVPEKLEQLRDAWQCLREALQ